MSAPHPTLRHSLVDYAEMLPPINHGSTIARQRSSRGRLSARPVTTNSATRVNTHAECFDATRRTRMAPIIRFVDERGWYGSCHAEMHDFNASLFSRTGKPILVRAFLSPRVPFASARPRPTHLRRPASTRSSVGTLTPRHTPASFRTMGGFACRGTVHRLPLCIHRGFRCGHPASDAKEGS
jgi:hypothetical protein